MLVTINGTGGTLSTYTTALTICGKVDTTLVNLNFVLRSVSNRSGHPPPLSKGGFEVQAKISKREGLKNFWIKEGAFPERGGVENFKEGG